MTAAEHLAYAEELLDQLRHGDIALDPMSILVLAMEAQGHALVALAAETGVPHPAPPPAGGTSATG